MMIIMKYSSYSTTTIYEWRRNFSKNNIMLNCSKVYSEWHTKEVKKAATQKDRGIGRWRFWNS